MRIFASRSLILAVALTHWAMAQARWQTLGDLSSLQGVSSPVNKQTHVLLDDLATCLQAQIHRPHLQSRRSPDMCCAVDNFETNFCQTALVSC